MPIRGARDGGRPLLQLGMLDNRRRRGRPNTLLLVCRWIPGLVCGQSSRPSADRGQGLHSRQCPSTSLTYVYLLSRGQKKHVLCACVCENHSSSTTVQQKHVPLVYIASITGTRHFCSFGTTSVQVSLTSEISVRYGYWHQTFGEKRYDMDTGTEYFRKFGTTSTPVTNTSVSSLQHQQRWRTPWEVRCNIDTCTGHFAQFGTRPCYSCCVEDVSLLVQTNCYSIITLMWRRCSDHVKNKSCIIYPETVVQRISAPFIFDKNVLVLI